MTERDGAAIGVHVFIVIRNPELAEHRQSLAGKRLVQLYDVNVRNLQAQPVQQFLSGRRGPDSSQRRRAANPYRFAWIICGFCGFSKRIRMAIFYLPAAQQNQPEAGE